MQSIKEPATLLFPPVKSRTQSHDTTQDAHANLAYIARDTLNHQFHSTRRTCVSLARSHGKLTSTAVIRWPQGRYPYAAISYIPPTQRVTTPFPRPAPPVEARPSRKDAACITQQKGRLTCVCSSIIAATSTPAPNNDLNTLVYPNHHAQQSLRLRSCSWCQTTASTFQKDLHPCQKFAMASRPRPTRHTHVMAR